MNKWMYVNKYPEHVFKCFGAYAIADIEIFWQLLSQICFPVLWMCRYNDDVGHMMMMLIIWWWCFQTHSCSTGWWRWSYDDDHIMMMFSVLFLSTGWYWLYDGNVDHMMISFLFNWLVMLIIWWWCFQSRSCSTGWWCWSYDDDVFSLVPVQLAGVPLVPVSVQHSGRTLWCTLWPWTVHYQMGCHCQGNASLPFPFCEETGRSNCTCRGYFICELYLLLHLSLSEPVKRCCAWCSLVLEGDRGGGGGGGVAKN